MVAGPLAPADHLMREYQMLIEWGADAPPIVSLQSDEVRSGAPSGERVEGRQRMSQVTNCHSWIQRLRHVPSP